VSKKLRDKLQILVDSGLYNNQAEVVREAIRNLLKEETNLMQDDKKEKK
jgi:Arc/MetJ-type ribon-helix-helix transcriptional regulator